MNERFVSVIQNIFPIYCSQKESTLSCKAKVQKKTYSTSIIQLTRTLSIICMIKKKKKKKYTNRRNEEKGTRSSGRRMRRRKRRKGREKGRRAEKCNVRRLRRGPEYIRT